MPIDPSAAIELTAFKWVPPFARGQVRDLRPRWAMEEQGLDYRLRLLDATRPCPEPYLLEQPWGQVPVLDDGGVTLFESGAILLHLAQKDERLLPADPQRRATATSWLFAAFNSIEPLMFELSTVSIFSRDAEWATLRKPSLMETLGGRLDRLADRLGDAGYLDGEFTVADIAMATVLRVAHRTALVPDRPRLAAYLARCEARPAFQRALADQLAEFDRNEPAAA
ncbi:glutathione S-transferase family protein [Novosphingobium lentum]|uniref:glutathione S-transferase family protein n=1 Tax=Novosphingobium lentum TaxID=145287 RepID=UPI0008361DE2|nr:glutathione S-transferase family protein [Novosphingobium lentum]